ncbi:hypothetical protein GGR56DRAFT_694116 [Xylariaceae sp. FL0804]|nr:hypothetical protein GGR56DRAFT_694116 [Xylariaceae sp. FL0804]
MIHDPRSDPRYRYSGHRSPTFNPARASMPANIGYNSSQYTGDIHAVPTARYDAASPRRSHDHKAGQTTTITTYNVTKEPVARSASHNRYRSSTVDSSSSKPVIVTTNHSKPYGSSSHASSGTKATSPPRDPYRSSEETYYAQPASSIRGRSQHHHSHSYTPGSKNDELYRLRERVGGDERIRAPASRGADPFRQSRPSTKYGDGSYAGSSAVADYEDAGYEYTRPSDLARYDLSRGREQRGARRESFDRSYYRPHVNVVSAEPARYEPRSRAKPPTSAGLDRYNRAAASGAYERPTVTMPVLPVVPAPPPMDPVRRPAVIEPSPGPAIERRTSRPRPISLYQESPARMSHPDDLYRPRDDERIYRDRRERDDFYHDENITSRGFGLRTDGPEAPIRPASAIAHKDHDDRRRRRDTGDRDGKRPSDESLNYTRAHERRPADEARSFVEGGREPRESAGRRGSISRTRDKVVAGLGAAAAAVGLNSKADDKASPRTSPRLRETEEQERDDAGSGATGRYKPRERDTVERRSPREDFVERRREKPREILERGPSPREDLLEPRRDRLGDRDARETEVGRGREDAQERQHEERDRERYQKDAEARLGGTVTEARDGSPASEGSAKPPPKRRGQPAAFDPTDTKGLMDLKAELKALDEQNQPARRFEKSSANDAGFDKDTPKSSNSSLPIEARDESRGREIVPARDDKQVRVVSPPRDKSDQKPIKGILKQPTANFPEDEHPVREGVAPHKDDKTKKDVPPGARWTRVSRRMVNPEALEIGKERFEVRDDFVIVLRVLSKEEIQAYAEATSQLREMRRKEYERNNQAERVSDEERNRSDEEKQRRHRHRRDREEDEYRREPDVEDRRRHHHRHSGDFTGPESRPKAIEYDDDSSTSHHHRPRAPRDYDSVTTASDERR